MATEQKKKQFSLSLMMRIFLGALVLISIGIFANSVMYYNQLNQEAEELQEALAALHETRDELNELLGSAEEVNRLLDDREAYEEIINSGNEASEFLLEYKDRLAEVNRLLNSSKNRDYIVKIAREELGLYFADEEIFYNDMNN